MELMRKPYSRNKIGLSISRYHRCLSFHLISEGNDLNDLAQLKEIIKKLDRWAVREDLGNKYQLQKKIGEGLTSIVYHVSSLNTPTKLFALKVIEKRSLSEELKSQIVEEIRLQRKFNLNPNVVKLHRVFESKKQITLQLDLIQDGDLQEWIKRKKKLSEPEI